MAEIECPNCGETFEAQVSTGNLDPDETVKAEVGGADWVKCPTCEETFFPG